MSLFGTLQMTGNTLQAMQVGLHVTGNNIANANTPGFIREEVIYAPAPVQKLGSLTLGLGVEIAGIQQAVDGFLADRLRTAAGDTASADVQNKAYKDLEKLLNALDGQNNIGAKLSDFLGTINNLSNPLGGDPIAQRSQVIQAGKVLAENISVLDRRVLELRDQLDTAVEQSATSINKLTSTIQELNVRISAVEGGGASNSEAGALRTQRQNAVAELSKIVGVTTTEQESGGLSISVGGEFLVFEGIRREVGVVSETIGGIPSAAVEFADTQSKVELVSGELAGLVKSRDEIVGGFHDSLNDYAGTLIFEFNKIYSQGQGLAGFQSLSSREAVTDPSKPLDEVGLAFAPTSGSFELLVRNRTQNVTEPHTISIDLEGREDDTTLSSLAEQLNAVEGISASVTPEGRLAITADSQDVEFAFQVEKQSDESGVLAALGLNTFFLGNSAENIGVNPELSGVNGARRLATSRGGIANDNDNALLLEKFDVRPLDSLEGATIANRYDQLVSDITQGSTVAGSVLEGYETFQATLDGEFQAISGVNIDEEALNMITLQRIYQASARLVRTISEMLDVLVNI